MLKLLHNSKQTLNLGSTSCTFQDSAFMESLPQEICRLTERFVKRFWRINRGYVFFHLFFGSALFFQLVSFGLFFQKLAQTTLIAFYLAAIFLTIFAYLVLMFYLQAQKPEKLLTLRNEFITACNQLIVNESDSAARESLLFQALSLFISKLSIRSLGASWITLSTTFAELVEKFCVWSQWKDLLKMKELLLMVSIWHYIERIKIDPSDLEIHATLANQYIVLSKLYQDPSQLTLNEILKWIPSEYQSEKMKQKAEIALFHALEEYQIIDNYAPNNPWVHLQCAAIYRNLEQCDKELKEYEKIFKNSPKNSEILLRLGALYFKQGQNALGLQMYDQLKSLDSRKAEQLIAHYNAYAVLEDAIDSRF